VAKSPLASRLRAVRKQQGLTLRGLGQKANLSHSFLSDIEAGRSMPSVDTLDQLARVLGVTVDNLLGRGDDSPPPIRVALHRTDGYDKPLPPEAWASIEEFIELMHLKYLRKQEQEREREKKT